MIRKILLEEMSHSNKKRKATDPKPKDSKKTKKEESKNYLDDFLDSSDELEGQCPGCVPHFQPGQLAHMVPGGCLDWPTGCLDWSFDDSDESSLDPND
jgi:hypothetical protein